MCLKPEIDLEWQDEDVPFYEETIRKRIQGFLAGTLCRRIQRIFVTVAICVAIIINITFFIGLTLSSRMVCLFTILVLPALVFPFVAIIASSFDVNVIANMLSSIKPNTILRSPIFLFLKRLARRSRRQRYDANLKLLEDPDLPTGSPTSVSRRGYAVSNRFVSFIRFVRRILGREPDEERIFLV
ncbi:hypothetical protein F5B17DRAFT_433394 [Nemania serpens]|nr:hypothetical protein F5B17DRAFT_433394 [Nemania serpens]